MPLSEFRFRERLRVRWAEIDAQQIVFNGHYLMYFDTAMAGYWRALALPYAETMASFAGDLFVRKATVEYLGSARYDDVLEIGLRCCRVGTSSIAFAGAATRRQQLLVTCELVYVFADPHLRLSRPLPAPLRALFDDFEAGQAMTDVRLGDWHELGVAARTVREQVFVVEQKIPAAMEWDDADEAAVHAVVFNRLGRPLATGRMVHHAPGVARIGRMAVMAGLRSGGIGRAVLDALLAASRRRGDREAMLHAQMSAVSFYERAGFSRCGEVFEEAGIAHVAMSRVL